MRGRSVSSVDLRHISAREGEGKPVCAECSTQLRCRAPSFSSSRWQRWWPQRASSTCLVRTTPSTRTATRRRRSRCGACVAPSARTRTSPRTATVPMPAPTPTLIPGVVQRAPTLTRTRTARAAPAVAGACPTAGHTDLRH